MRRWLRRLRGALGIGTLWGVAGTVVGVVGGAIGGLLLGLPVGYLMPVFGLYAGSTGFLLGSGFSLILAVQGERGALGELSPKRAAVLGAIAGAALPLAWLLAPFGELLTDLTALPLGQFLMVLLASGATCGALGAAMAAGTLALARRAPEQLTASEVPIEPVLMAAREDG